MSPLSAPLLRRPNLPAAFLRSTLLATAVLAAACGTEAPAPPGTESTEAAAPAGPSDSEEQIRALHRLSDVVLRSGDAQAAAARFTEDGRLLLPAQPPAVGRAAILGLYRGMFETPTPEMEGELVRVAVAESGDLAYALSEYTVTVQTPAGSFQDHGNRLTVYRRVDGAWLIEQEVVASLGSPAGGVTAEPTGD